MIYLATSVRDSFLGMEGDENVVVFRVKNADHMFCLSMKDNNIYTI